MAEDALGSDTDSGSSGTNSPARFDHSAEVNPNSQGRRVHSGCVAPHAVEEGGKSVGVWPKAPGLGPNSVEQQGYAACLRPKSEDLNSDSRDIRCNAPARAGESADQAANSPR
jgi:hypothetical protein